LSADTSGLAPLLEARWAGLPTPTGSGATVVDLPTATSNGAVLLGRTAAGRCLFIPFRANAHSPFSGDRRSRGVHLLRRPFDRQEGHRWYAELVCLDAVLEPVFTSLCVDLLVRLEASDEDPVHVTIRVLRSWRALLASSGRPLAIGQLAGLFGELLVLQRLLVRNPAAGTCWRGPFRETHDFRSGPSAIEVKTTIGEEGRRFRVHGIAQLEAPDDGRLSLALLQVEIDIESGLTVPDLAAKLIKLGESTIVTALAAAGYRAEESDVYDRYPFAVRSEEWFAVGAHFPRIVRSSFPGGAVPPGTANLHYDVDLAGAAVPPMSAEAIDDALEELA
jgi:hypothetical protein